MLFGRIEAHLRDGDAIERVCRGQCDLTTLAGQIRSRSLHRLVRRADPRLALEQRLEWEREVQSRSRA